MLYLPPKLKYSGLTVIMSNPSRFDIKSLLEGTGGWFFKNECLSPESNIFVCDTRLVDDPRPLLPGTKCLLLLGQKSLTLNSSLTTNLAEQRGSPLTSRQGIPAIASFLPQDTVDVQNFEKQYNKQAEGYEEEGYADEEEGTAGEYINAKGKGKTKRSNWRFWLRSDTKKAIRICKAGCIPSSKYTPRYHVAPNSETVIRVLTTEKHKDLFIDIETDFDSCDMRCFAFSFGPNADNICDIYVVPTLDIRYKPFYATLPWIMRALAVAMRDNCTVAHNGALFDFLIFAWKYRIPIGKCTFDTLIANNRIFPEVERSLGHCVSYWTYEPYHKNEAVHSYMTDGQARQLWEYCGKDVFTMILVKEAQLAYADTIPGLRSSIEQAMASIRPYLITALLGLHFNDEERQSWIGKNDRLMTQYLRIMGVLMGPGIDPLISNQKCCKYFHELMGYPVVTRSKKTGNPSLAKNALLKLRLKHENPVIDVLIRYRLVQKETGTLGFLPWNLYETTKEANPVCCNPST